MLVLPAAAYGPSADPPGPAAQAEEGSDAPVPVTTDTASAAAPTQPYTNERFGYSLDVPAGFEQGLF
ncbi:hypothetical protein [Rubrivirga marina]|uniref:Uncharacterized protein n=1 Tax=Rubrivirga marina TaxID=1196024 RepID=A0A271J2M5_9BACT|nr:hypothetical protein [Rubrivirga marina]PAP77518.1 hypothetical protein BSZ37_14255 [Rubrivirga marina]